jgi:tRNA threonylcarbamoyladenosine biosynthesis protein TsaB
MSTPAGPLLALDSSVDTGSVAVGTGERLLAEAALRVGGGASASLLPAVDWALRTAGVRPGDLAGVVVGAGPGSFTGVRVAAATAKGIVHALGVPLFAFSSLLAAAAPHGVAGRPVCALFDARRRDVYAACYRLGEGGFTEIVSPIALSLDGVVSRFAAGEPPLFVGDGALLHAAELRDTLGATVVPPQLSGPRAAALLWMAGQAPERGRVEDPAAWEPLYLRASGAERIAAARAAT